MDERIALKTGTTIENKYTILSEIGRGGSCIVYSAEYMDNAGYGHIVRIKELYPYALNCVRSDNEISVKSDQHALFSAAEKEFIQTYENNLLFFGDAQLMNHTVEARDIIRAYGTTYIVYSCDGGITFDRYTPSSIKECLEIVLSTAKVIKRYHELGFLHLDIKPSNIFVLDGTKDMVVLFDFDSVCKKADLQTGRIRCISYSDGYAAPEQMENRVEKISEATDIYAISAMLYGSLFGTLPDCEQRRHDATFNFDAIKYSVDTCDDMFFSEMDSFFRHTLCANPKARYSNIGLAINMLEKLIYLSTPLSDAQIAIMLSDVEKSYDNYRINNIINSLEVLASKGVGRAIYYITEIYDHGFGKTLKDSGKAAVWRHKGLDTKDALARLNGAYCYPKDSEERNNILSEVVPQLEQLYREDNNLSAGYEFAFYLLDTEYEKGRIILQELRRKKFWRAIGDLGLLYEKEGMIEAAIMCYKEASELGEGDASYRLGYLYENNTDICNYTEAAKYYTLAFEQGLAIAANAMGMMICNNRIESRHVSNKSEWYRKGYDAGDHAGAAYNLGVCYENGDGVIKNHSRAIKLYEIAANTGFVPALTEAGIIARNEKRTEDALKWLKEASAAEDPRALFALANMYYNGEGMQADGVKAMELFEKSAEKGYKFAEYRLGRELHMASVCEKDDDRSCFWLQKAADNGVDLAVIYLKRWFGIGSGVTYRNGIFRSADYLWGVDLSDKTVDEIEEYNKAYVTFKHWKYFGENFNLRITLGIPEWERLILGYDNSILHNGKSGFAFTTDGIYCKGRFDVKVHHTDYIDFVNEDIRIVENKKTMYVGNSKIVECYDRKIFDDLWYLIESMKICIMIID